MYATQLYTKKEKEDKRNGFYTSIAIHMLMILLLLMIPMKKAIEHKEKLQGIVVAFGNPNGGDNTLTEKPIMAEAMEENVESPEAVEEKQETFEEEVKQTEVPTQKVEATIVEEKSPIVAAPEKVIERQSETVDKQAEAATASAAAAKAREQAEAEKQAESKSKFSSLFGQGTSGEEDEQKGDEFGIPDASVLEGLSKGTGEAGDGLDSRGLVYEPNISDNSQRSGDVVVKVCVDATGNVISAKYTQRGSSTTDSYLINLAEQNAKKYRFTKSSAKEQCGTITIHFIVQ